MSFSSASPSLSGSFASFPVQLLLLAQNERCLAPDFCGAFRFDPVALLYLDRPFAVKPPPLDTGSFSPRPTDSDGFLRVVILSPGKI